MGKYVKTFEQYSSLQEDIIEIMKGYLEAAFWTNGEMLEEEIPTIDDEPIYSITEDMLDDDSKIKAYLDIKRFLELAGPAVDNIDLQHLGHDIWLTRNGHGTGFWDRGYDQDVADKLTASAKAIGSVDMYIGDYNKIHFSNSHL